MNVDLFDQENKKVGTTELPEEVFGTKWNPTLVHQIVESMRANARHPWAHAKGRGEVRGGGKKPWRQKGTGRSRHGSIRSPIWPGGGVSHGPLKERNYEQKINKKMRRAALFSVLSKKLKDNQLQVVNTFEIAEPRTKIVSGIVNNFRDVKKPTTLLIIPKTGDKNIYRAARNLKRATAIDPNSLNVYDVMRHKTVLLDQGAIETIRHHFSGAQK
jgi:large subunit ribosomal protein L4